MRRRESIVDAQTVRNIVRTLAAETKNHPPQCPCPYCRRLQSWRAEAKRFHIELDDDGMDPHA